MPQKGKNGDVTRHTGLPPESVSRSGHLRHAACAFVINRFRGTANSRSSTLEQEPPLATHASPLPYRYSCQRLLARRSTRTYLSLLMEQSPRQSTAPLMIKPLAANAPRPLSTQQPLTTSRKVATQSQTTATKSKSPPTTKTSSAPDTRITMVNPRISQLMNEYLQGWPETTMSRRMEPRPEETTTTTTC